MAIIAIASTKGGVGKTSIAFSLAKDLDYRYVTNDMSIVINKYKKAKYYPNKIPLYENTIYDFGGFVDKHADLILNEADVILLPTTNDKNSIMKSQILIKAFKHKTILVFANMIENQRDYETIKTEIHRYFPNLAFTHLRRTKLLKNALENGQSAKELYESTNQTQYVYRHAYEEYAKILSLFTQEANAEPPQSH
ncbi:MAG: hypothetical protein U9N52_00545 [Campylobacterota bacterium]|nr:hypothetical protein [Campylobacterota bacterium]